MSPTRVRAEEVDDGLIFRQDGRPPATSGGGGVPGRACTPVVGRSLGSDDLYAVGHGGSGL